MKILIDTHIFIWLAAGSIEKIKPQHLDILYHENIYFSAVSLAEISIKKSIKKLKIDGDLLEVLNAMQIKIIDFNSLSALKLEHLPLYHKDTFDRMLISQSITGNYKFLSYDAKFKNYTNHGLKII